MTGVAAGAGVDVAVGFCETGFVLLCAAEVWAVCGAAAGFFAVGADLP
ncbi:hypothetical protein [Gluconobacter sp.]